MDRNIIIDRLLAELRRQAEHSEHYFQCVKGRDPDTVHVIGLLDVHKLAQAVRGE